MCGDMLGVMHSFVEGAMRDAMHHALHPATPAATPAATRRQVVFPGLSDNEVLRLVNQHTPGGQEQRLSEEAVLLHEESVLSAEGSLGEVIGEGSVARLVSSQDERGGRASAAMARRSLAERSARNSPTAALDELSLSGARNSGESSKGGDAATEPSDPPPDLLQLSTGARRRILERQASGMHHSQAFELEG